MTLTKMSFFLQKMLKKKFGTVFDINRAAVFDFFDSWFFDIIVWQWNYQALEDESRAFSLSSAR